MNEPNESGPVADERVITPVAGTTNSRHALALRGAGAAAMVGFVALVLWGTWHSKSEQDESPEKVVVRQSAPFEAAREPPLPPEAPVQQATLPMARPAPAVSQPKRTAEDELLEASRRAPVLAYNRPPRTAATADGVVASPSLSDISGYPLNGFAEPRNELADKLKPTPIEGVRAARLPNRNLLVTQGTSIPCVLETAMSSDVPGFVSCVITRDVISDSGHVVLMEKGTQVVGEYRGSVRRGSKRMFVLWTRAKTPTGVIVSLASPATDALGRAGFDGELDTHFWERFGAALLLSVVGDAGAYASRRLTDVDIEVNATQNAGSSAAGIAVERSIDIPPTLNKNQGELVSIFVARDLDFSSVYDLRVIGSRREVRDRSLSRVAKP